MEIRALSMTKQEEEEEESVCVDALLHEVFDRGLDLRCTVGGMKSFA